MSVNPNVFGVNLPASGRGESVPGIATADQSGLQYFSNLFGLGVQQLAGDFDFGGPNAGGQAVYLPKGSMYRYLGNDPGPWGNLLSFETPNGGIINLPHLENIAVPQQGQLVPGGQVIGYVGKGPYSSQYWTGPHFAVILDTAAAQFLAGKGGGAAAPGGSSTDGTQFAGLSFPGLSVPGVDLNPSDWVSGFLPYLIIVPGLLIVGYFLLDRISEKTTGQPVSHHIATAAEAAA